MYYQVTLIRKNPNQKEMILKVNDDETKDERYEKAKKFLFPDVESDKLHVYSVCFPITMNERMKVDYERIIVNHLSDHPMKDNAECDKEEYEPNLDNFFEGIIKADSKENITQEQIFVECAFPKDKDLSEYEIYFDEVSVEELIKEEELHRKKRLMNHYIRERVSENLPIREYNKQAREFDFTKNLDAYYEALCEENRMDNIERILRKRYDLSKVSVLEFDKAVMALFKSTTAEECDEILAKFKKLY